MTQKTAKKTLKQAFAEAYEQVLANSHNITKFTIETDLDITPIEITCGGSTYESGVGYKYVKYLQL